MLFAITRGQNYCAILKLIFKLGACGAEKIWFSVLGKTSTDKFCFAFLARTARRNFVFAWLGHPVRTENFGFACLACAAWRISWFCIVSALSIRKVCFCMFYAGNMSEILLIEILSKVQTITICLLPWTIQPCHRRYFVLFCFALVRCFIQQQVDAPQCWSCGKAGFRAFLCIA